MTSEQRVSVQGRVLTVAQLGAADIEQLLRRYEIEPGCVPDGAAIPGSYWGESEAGLAGNRLYWRLDTPMHSILHEAAHFICMDGARRAGLERDAGGDHDEENAVCYLQILLADCIRGLGRERMWQDMDAWGYTFRLGSARAWFEQDAADARRWLITHQLIDEKERLTWKSRI